jgi:YegS/Rv2252/BmrU family lipid kinase
MYKIISNPTAGKRGNKQALALTKEVFDAAGVSYEVFETTCRGEAQDIVKKLTEGGEEIKLVIVGGDGTLHETLNGIAEPEKCLLGIIPAGTGNDFAEAAKIPLDAKEAARLILEGEAKPTDYLEMGGVRCMNVAGMGIDTEILQRCERGRMKGKLKYLISLLQSVLSFKGWQIKFKQGEETVELNTLVTAACNGQQFGGGLKICSEAVIDDGKIDVVVVEHIKGIFNLGKALVTLLKGKITTYPKTRHFLCEEIEVNAPPCTVQLDGELYSGLEFKVKVRKGLRIFR